MTPHQKSSLETSNKWQTFSTGKASWAEYWKHTPSNSISYSTDIGATFSYVPDTKFFMYINIINLSKNPWERYFSLHFTDLRTECKEVRLIVLCHNVNSWYHWASNSCSLTPEVLSSACVACYLAYLKIGKHIFLLRQTSGSLSYSSVYLPSLPCHTIVSNTGPWK